MPWYVSEYIYQYYMITVLQKLNFFEVLLLSVGINLLLYLLSIGCYYLIDRLSRRKSIQEKGQAFTRKDLQTSIYVLCCNALVFVAGVQLWHLGIITVQADAGIPSILPEVILLIIAMDFLMYIFHRTAHLPLFYRLIHGRHHDHESTNAISLFVMHPAEAIGFGFTLIFVLCWYPFSSVAIAVYIFINLLWGTVGHLNKEILPGRWSSALRKSLLGTTIFHNRHHQHPNYNFGFYTSLWDKLFGTLVPEKDKP